MKTCFNVFLIALVSLQLIACSNLKEDGYTTIKGTVTMPYKKDLDLLKVVNGKEVVVATATLNDENKFGFAINPDTEGFYMISDGFIDIPLYIKGNQDFEISFNEAEGYTLTNAPDAENEVLFNWTKKIDTLRSFNFRTNRKVTFKEFFPFYAQFIPEMKAQQKTVNTNNAYFNKLMRAYIELTIEEHALKFLYTPRAIHPKKEQMATFYQDFMESNAFKNSLALQLPGGLNTLRMHQTYKAINNANARPKSINEAIVHSVNNDTLKAFLALDYVKKYKTYNQHYLDFINPIRPVLNSSPYVQEEIEKYESSIRTMNVGGQGYNFTYKDINGSNVSFNSLKGHLVYVDLWATWCAPCKAQIPFLKKLEKDFQGKPIKFVSISLDKPKDKVKWETFVKEENLGGIQLFSDKAFQTSIVRDYKVTNIPRFMLFDKDGKIVDPNAKRPSDPSLKKQLNKLLN